MNSSPKRILLLVLLASGIASIINQVVWQRALKIYLSGSEAVSSMIVVLVFMLGLGTGAWLAGQVARKLSNPLRMLGLIELALAAINVIVCFLLSLDLHHSVYAFQRLALERGFPLQWLYAITASVLLAAPCMLMGMTVPLASEVSQRQLKQEEARFLSTLFFLNTLGAILGAVAGSVVLLPLLGQRLTLLFAVGLNALAGMLAWLTAASVSLRQTRGESQPAADPAAIVTASKYPPELWAGFCLGFVSLAFEMYLYRLASLVFTPLPYTFALVLTGFLLVWSLGVFYGGRWTQNIPVWMSALSLSLLLVMPAYILARWGCGGNPPGIAFKCGVFLTLFIPCFPFGILFTQLVTSYVSSWGKDVGRYFACNTFGSCLGIVSATLLGFEHDSEYGLWLFAGICAILATYFQRREATHSPAVPGRHLVKSALSVWFVLFLFELAIWQAKGHRLNGAPVIATFNGKGGVVEITVDRSLIWDGLWHSQLSRDGDHIGTSNWRLAAIPLLCHPHDKPELEACVIGLGTGITVGTLARSRVVRHVDVYEINSKLADLLKLFPNGTLNVATDPKVGIFWQDGRTGLALRDKRYDLITQQPLYLKQAGSSILLSREYMELVRSRLNEKGVFCIYCNSLGNDQQAMMVRKTARLVFRHCASFGRGYMILASDTPIQFDERLILSRTKDDQPIQRECVKVGIGDLCQYRDSNPLPWESPFLVTDDHPLVEYPALIRLLTR